MTLWFIRIFAIMCCATWVNAAPLTISKLPFFNDSLAYTIKIADKKTTDTHYREALYDILKAELKEQRKHNRQLKQLTRPAKIAQLEKELLLRRLRAEGFYAATIQHTIKENHITYRIYTDELYRIHRIILDMPTPITIDTSKLSISEGTALHVKKVLTAQKELYDIIAKDYCLFEIKLDYTVALSHKDKAANVHFRLEDSPNVTIGNIAIEGLTTIEKSYLKARLPLKSGDCFRREQIDNARLTLIQSNLLSSIQAKIGRPKTDNTVDIVFIANERAHKTMSLGIGFQTDQGAGISGGWEHRNLFGRAEKFNIDALLAERLQRLDTRLTLPHWKRNKQSLSFYSTIERETTDAFDERSGTLGIELSRSIGQHLNAGLGTEISFSRIEEDDNKEDFALLSVPFSISYDRRDDILDPRKGWIASIRTQPYWDMYDTDTTFLKSTFVANGYYSPKTMRYGRPTFALRTVIGTINGEDRDTIPASIRFYSGGGGSVRGYPFQSLSTFRDDEPDGGLSFNELSFETRLRWGKSWGGVAFVDGGYAYEGELPDIGEDLLWAAGLGLRYYTSFAPIRLDIAVPLDKRENIDDDFQLYISIGQAF